MIYPTCYFCEAPLQPAKPDVSSKRFVCQRHPMWIWHYYDDDELSKIYMPVERDDGIFGFALRPKLDTVVLSYWASPIGDAHTPPVEICRLSSIPHNLYPENAQEKLSFYLTYY